MYAGIILAIMLPAYSQSIEDIAGLSTELLKISLMLRFKR